MVSERVLSYDGDAVAGALEVESALEACDACAEWF